MRIRLGKKKFSVKNDHVIYRYNPNRLTLLAGAFSTAFLIFPLVGLSGLIEQRLAEYGYIFSTHPIFILIPAALVSFQSRLFRQKIIFDRKNQKVVSSYVFFILRRKMDYKNVLYDYIYTGGYNGGNGQTRFCFLSETIKRRVPEKYFSYHYFMYSERDKRFVSDLRDYMHYKHPSDRVNSFGQN